MTYNYILITVDALRADHLNIYGYKKRITSPAIDEFAKQSSVYLNAYACGVPTFLSFPSIFCSIYPSKVMQNMYLPKNIPTFVELLKNKGFQTAAFIDNNPFCSTLLGYNRGFDLIDDYFVESLRNKKKTNVNFRLGSKIIYLVKYLISTELVQPETNAEQIMQNAIKFIKSSRENFFVWMHFMDTHSPFSFPNYSNPLMKYRMLKAHRIFSCVPGEREYNEEDGQLMEEMYDTSIRRLDTKLEGFFDSLQKEGILQNSYVFITSDHGEELLERGTLDHQENVYQEVTNVPFIIKKPGAEEPAKMENMVSLLDIPTTILINEGISVPKEYEGDPIFQSKRNYAISETVVPSVNKLANNRDDLYKVQFNDFIYSIRDEEYTVIYDKDNKYKFFNRKDDVIEKKGIGVPTDDLNDLLSSLKEHQAKKYIHSFDIERVRLKQRLRRLRALGKT